MRWQQKHVWANIQDISEVQTLQKQRSYRLDSWETKVEAVPLPNWGTGQLREFEAELIPRRPAAACSVVPVSGPSSVALQNGRCLRNSRKFHEIPWNPSGHPYEFDEMILKCDPISRCLTWVNLSQPRPRQCSTKRHIQSNGCTSWQAASDEAAARQGPHLSESTNQTEPLQMRSKMRKIEKIAKDLILRSFPRSTYKLWLMTVTKTTTWRLRKGKLKGTNDLIWMQRTWKSVRAASCTSPVFWKESSYTFHIFLTKYMKKYKVSTGSHI